MLGKLKKIDDLRAVWKNEARDFTNWLAQDENLALLSDEIDIGIKLIQTEANVGDFNVDILAEEENSGRKIIIENQLASTNHDHLGKLITYASGHDAEIIIWIVKDVREEHKHAVDWLNEHTDEKISFFLVKLELWQIGDSPLAPKFQVISDPNEWAKALKSVPNQELTDTKLTQLEFWNNFKAYAVTKGTALKFRTARPQHWYDISYGSSESHISLTINTQTNKLGCELYIDKSKELYNKFLANKKQIESDLGETLEWMELPDRKASRIKIQVDGDISDAGKLETHFNWLKTEAEKFHAVFSKYLRK